jgi:hypothetical protein
MRRLEPISVPPNLIGSLAARAPLRLFSRPRPGPSRLLPRRNIPGCSSKRSFCHARISAIAWDSGDGEVTGVNVWDTPGAIAEFFIERVGPFVEAEGEPTNKPRRHGEPLAFYIRPS